MPSAPALETAAASGGMAAMGAWTIGCSIPSSSHTGVVTAVGPFRDPGRLREAPPGHSYEDGTDPDRRSQP